MFVWEKKQLYIYNKVNMNLRHSFLLMLYVNKNGWMLKIIYIQFD